MTRPDAELDSAQILREVPVPDDAGAQTADRYEWQAMMATADVLSMYFSVLDSNGSLLDDAEFTIICEHHEDWAVVNGSKSEIVSGKHREASVGPIATYRQLLADGGVLHLFKRWQALEQTPLCRLVTTGGLSGDCAKVARTCERLRREPETEEAEVVEVVGALAGSIALLSSTEQTTAEPESDDVVRAFLISLTLQDSEARRDHLPDMASERYGRPVAARLGLEDACAAVWHAVLALVRPRMRAAGPSVGGALPTVLGVAHDDDSLAARTLTLADVDTAVRFAMANSSGYEPLPRIIKANKMAVKMARGGCSDNAIERADDLRLQYRQYWRAVRGNPNVSDRRRQIDNALRRVIDEATDLVRVDDNPTWGAQLWRELGDRLDAIVSQPDAQGLNVDLLLGGISELANNCRVWYTDRFDATAELKRIVEGTSA